jgi:putative endonuclease
MAFFTYLLASARHGTLYCGHTDDLADRLRKHREKTYSGFTAKYSVTRLVWYEAHETREGAFRRERRIKKWERAWKIRMIEGENPTWSDLVHALNRPDEPVHPDLADLIDPVTRLPRTIPNSAHPREGGDPSGLSE